MTPKEIFETLIPSRLTEESDLAAKVNAVYQFVITGSEGGEWTLNLASKPPAVTSGRVESPGCTITMTDKDFMDLTSGKLNGQAAFMTGRLKVAGNMSLVLKLQSVVASLIKARAS